MLLIVSIKTHNPHFTNKVTNNMSGLMDKMKKASFVDNAAVLSKSQMFKNKEFIPLKVPMMNVAFSGKLDGGFSNGLIQLAGPSKHFKSNMGLVLCEGFQEAEPDGVIIFYDNEFGSTEDYFANAGVDIDRVLHVPFLNLEELKFDLIQKLEAIDPKTDKVMIFIDSVGNAASKKEVEDAIKQNSASDMTRAKVIKGIFRMVTPYLTQKKIPMVVINHTYQTQEMYSKTVVSGGTGIEYSSNSIFTIGKQQIKEGKELEGFDFIMNAYKSRYIKERSAIPITVTFSGGINRWSGLMEVAKALGWVNVRSAGSKGNIYTRPFLKEGADTEFKKDSINTELFWGPIIKEQKFKDAVEEMFTLTSSKLFTIDEKSGEAVVHTDVSAQELVEEEDFDPTTGEVYEE